MGSTSAQEGPRVLGAAAPGATTAGACLLLLSLLCVLLRMSAALFRCTVLHGWARHCSACMCACLCACLRVCMPTCRAARLAGDEQLQAQAAQAPRGAVSYDMSLVRLSEATSHAPSLFHRLCMDCRSLTPPIPSPSSPPRLPSRRLPQQAAPARHASSPRHACTCAAC